jgi:hypothetical protein
LTVTAISLESIRCPGCINPATSNVFVAQIGVHFDFSRSLRALRPATVQVTLQTAVGGGAIKTITGCSTGTVPTGGCLRYVLASTGVVGNRACWGTIIDGGTTVSCANGTAPVDVGYADDTVSNGEMTTNGVDLFTTCPNNPPMCHVTTSYCF